MAGALSNGFAAGSCWQNVFNVNRRLHCLETTTCSATIPFAHTEQRLKHRDWELFHLPPNLKKAARMLPSLGRRCSKSTSVLRAAASSPAASESNGVVKRSRKKKSKSAAENQEAPGSIRRSEELAAAVEQAESVTQKAEGRELGKQASNPAQTPGGKHHEPSSNGVARAKRLSPLITVTKPLPRVLILHTGGTLGMDPDLSFEKDRQGVHLREGTGGTYKKSLQPRGLLADLLSVVPELQHFANLDVRVVFNKDSCRVGPEDWVRLAKILHQQRNNFSAFIVVHGTDTMAYTASALSLMLAGFRKPIVLTGSQLPLSMPRSDARQNLIDSISCATSGPLGEVCICFGGVLLRGNRAQKTNASVYRAFSSTTYPHLASLGLEVEWDSKALLKHEGVYRPRFELNPNVIRIPIVPGCDPRLAYGDLYARGVRGLILEAFGVGNMPDTPRNGWLPWLRQQRKKGMQVYLSTQCDIGYLHPELYRSGSIAVALGVEAGPQMTPECACCKMMLCLAYPDIPLGQPIAGEL